MAMKKLANKFAKKIAMKKVAIESGLAPI